MRQLTVADVMTPEVVVATADCLVREIIDVLTDYGVSGLPVVDSDDRVIGVVSEADLLPALAGDADDDAVARRSARELMTTPAVSVGPDAGVRIAARLMARHRVGRLPVVEDGTGRLVGMLTRGDLIRRTMRSDAAVEHEIVDNVVLPAFGVDPTRIEVEVRDGVATLRGTVERRSAAQRLVALARTVDCVAAVDDRLRWRTDDTAPRRPAGRKADDPVRA
ncbi:CBS domain-containing protein [Dactylosporangium sp. CA-233914]|uniref:CBS domain-containing protein n=1 Tax=Dactylosporangium sp. CA-233914 TaxID=3239934 RepID=UPI003D925F93